MELSFKQKLIIGIVGTLVILGVGIYIYTTNGGKEEYNFNNFYTNVEADEQKESTIIVHITGKVKNAGIIELPEESRISDQTTPNMIQRISRIFERNPLISKEI